MFVYIVAAAQAFFYLTRVPLYLALRLRAGDGFHFGAGVAAFERRFAARGARRRKPKKAGAKPPDPRRVWRVLRRARIERAALRGELSLGSAAATALACGALRALSGGRAQVDVAPDFRAAAPRAELQGMIRVRTGQIMLAAVRCGMESLNGRIHPWKSIRSKVS